MATAGLNRVTLLGNIGAAPEMRFLASGEPVLNLRLATNESWTDKNGEEQSRTDWHSIVIFGRRAKALGPLLKKGMPIYIEGRLVTRSWETEENGTKVKKYRTEVQANNVLFTERKPNDVAAGSTDGPASDAPPGYSNGSGGNHGDAYEGESADIPF